jgi:hypothetical protein
MDYSDYFYRTFPGELTRYGLDHPSKADCPNCRTRVSQERRVYLQGVNPLEEPIQFRFAWYSITLLDQGLHRYFSDAYERWNEKTGGYPIPVVHGGLNCFGVLPPHALLDPADDLAEWETFLNFYLAEMRRNLEDYCGVSPSAFFGEIARDRDFNTPENPQETLLLKLAESHFGKRDA